MEMINVVSLSGPVETESGELVLRIPLSVGGNALLDSARGIGEVDGDDLKVTIPSWLAEKPHITDGSMVTVDNAGGKFNIKLSS